MRLPARKGLRAALAAAVAVSASVLGVVALNQADAATPQGGDPDIALMNQTGNHTMGSQVRLHEPGTQVSEAQLPHLTATVEGIDVASYQGNVNWASWWSQGKRFAYVKATEGTGYTNPYFSQQYNGSYNVGMIRGAYHFARPDGAGGAAQADYFIAHGGGWSADGKTLPGTLDIEWGPNSACYGLSQASMSNWILAFSNQYHARTHKYPMIYTATSWWSQCVGNHAFSSTNPLWVARYASAPGALPYNWGFYTIWQYSSAGNMDKDQFNGAIDRLKALATNPD
jgi:GH25 family lysozyme M1 (1,4-beta-N-acetylmuramidase)